MMKKLLYSEESKVESDEPSISSHSNTDEDDNTPDKI